MTVFTYMYTVSNGNFEISAAINHSLMQVTKKVSKLSHQVKLPLKIEQMVSGYS